MIQIWYSQAGSFSWFNMPERSVKRVFSGRGRVSFLPVIIISQASIMAYSTREIGHILGLPPYTVRYYACKGLGRPGQGKGHYYRFSFQELLLFKTICRLLFLGVSLRRVKRIMGNLPEQMPKGDPVTAAKIWTEGTNVLASYGSYTWDPESGQGFIDFGKAQTRNNVSHLEEYRAEGAQ